jgi:hypothetical protein
MYFLFNFIMGGLLSISLLSIKPKYSQHKQSFPAAFTYLIFQVQN